MMHLFDTKDYSWSLFIGHIVIEKILKARVVERQEKHAPFTHDLTKLAVLSGLNFTEELLDWLDTITTFNLNARYDSYKQAFYKKCTPDSDIDIAIVLNQVDDIIDTQIEFMKLRRNIDLRIEPHPFNYEDFNANNPVVDEILKYGINLNVA